MDPSIWNSKGGGRGAKNKDSRKSSSQPPAAGYKRKGDSNSSGPGGKAGGKKFQSAQSGGYTFGTNPLKTRMPAQTYPWGTGASDESIRLFANGSEYPGIAKCENPTLDTIPVIPDWLPCINDRCPAPSRQQPPYTRAGVSSFAVVSNSEIKCHHCYTQLLPVNSQRVISMYQKPLVSKLGGHLGALHPKFAGSKMYGLAKAALEINEANFDPNKPPVVSEFELPSPAEWLAQNGHGKGKKQQKQSSLDAVLTARASLARLENAVANDQAAATDFGKLSRAASGASLPDTGQAANSSDNPVDYCLPTVGIYMYLKNAIDNAKATGEEAFAAALEGKLNREFPDGEPQPPKEELPVKAPLSAPNELNLLATKQAQTLRELLSARNSLDNARAQVGICQKSLNEAKEAATKAAAQLAMCASNYEKAGLAIKDFNDKVHQAEMAAADAAKAESAADWTSKTETKIEAEDPNSNTAEPSYAAVVRGTAKAPPKDAVVLPTPPSPTVRKAEEHPDPDGDREMAASNSGSVVTSASKKLKKLADAQESQYVNDYTSIAPLLDNHKLAEDPAFYENLVQICQRYDLEPTDVIQAAVVKNENMVMLAITDLRNRSENG